MHQNLSIVIVQLSDMTCIRSSSHTHRYNCIAGGLALWAVLLIVVAAAAVLAAGGFAVYKYRIRTQMHQEIRAIMSQYMPLESDGTHEEKETLTGA